MAQTHEYPMFSPHPKAKLYKMYTGDAEVSIHNEDAITIQDNRYACVGKFLWIEATEKTENEYEPIDGLITPSGYMTIKTNSLKKFSDGDVVLLNDELWMVDGDAQAVFAYTPKKIQTHQFVQVRKVL